MAEEFNPYIKTRHPLQGPKGILVLVVTLAVGLLLVISVRNWRHKTLTSEPAPVAVQSPEKVLAAKEKARGPSRQPAFVGGETARVVTFAVGRRVDETWEGIAEDAIIRVTRAEIVDGESWVTGKLDEGKHSHQVWIHASFLERYLPVVLENTCEVSDVRLVKAVGSQPGAGVTGWLRNITSQTMSQCVVACIFQDRAGREVDVRRSETLTLAPYQLTRFQTAMRTEKPFASFAIQVTYAAPDGLRNYLSMVVVNKSYQP